MKGNQSGRGIFRKNEASRLIGVSFGRLTIIKRADDRIAPGNKLKAMAICRCECGNEKAIAVESLRRGHTKSCGCIQREAAGMISFSHGHATRKYGKSPTYSVWSRMNDRCYNQNHRHYPYYGGRGISICERWRGESGFNNFLLDMGERPNGKTIDRIDGDGNYEPVNCRWATRKEQSNNIRTNVWLEFNGEKKTLAQWSDQTGLTGNVITRRISRGWSIKDALTRPANRGNKLHS